MYLKWSWPNYTADDTGICADYGSDCWGLCWQHSRWELISWTYSSRVESTDAPFTTGQSSIPSIYSTRLYFRRQILKHVRDCSTVLFPFQLNWVAELAVAVVYLTLIDIVLPVQCMIYWFNFFFQWIISHSPPFSVRFCSVLPPPSSSSCTCILQVTQPVSDLFSRCSSLVVLFLCGHVASTGVLAWQCCHRTFLESVSSSQVHFLRPIWFSTLSPV